MVVLSLPNADNNGVASKERYATDIEIINTFHSNLDTRDDIEYLPQIPSQAFGVDTQTKKGCQDHLTSVQECQANAAGTDAATKELIRSRNKKVQSLLNRVQRLDADINNLISEKEVNTSRHVVNPDNTHMLMLGKGHLSIDEEVNSAEHAACHGKILEQREASHIFEEKLNILESLCDKHEDSFIDRDFQDESEQEDAEDKDKDDDEIISKSTLDESDVTIEPYATRSRAENENEVSVELTKDVAETVLSVRNRGYKLLDLMISENKQGCEISNSHVCYKQIENYNKKVFRQRGESEKFGVTTETDTSKSCLQYSIISKTEKVVESALVTRIARNNYIRVGTDEDSKDILSAEAASGDMNAKEAFIPGTVTKTPVLSEESVLPNDRKGESKEPTNLKNIMDSRILHAKSDRYEGLILVSSDSSDTIKQNNDHFEQKKVRVEETAVISDGTEGTAFTSKEEERKISLDVNVIEDQLQEGLKESTIEENGSASRGREDAVDTLETKLASTSVSAATEKAVCSTLQQKSEVKVKVELDDKYDTNEQLKGDVTGEDPVKEGKRDIPIIGIETKREIASKPINIVSEEVGKTSEDISKGENRDLSYQGVVESEDFSTQNRELEEMRQEVLSTLDDVADENSAREDEVENDDLSLGKKIDNEDITDEENEEKEDNTALKENEERLGEDERAVSSAVDLGNTNVVAANVIKCSSEEDSNSEEEIEIQGQRILQNKDGDCIEEGGGSDKDEESLQKVTDVEDDTEEQNVDGLQKLDTEEIKVEDSVISDVAGATQDTPEPSNIVQITIEGICSTDENSAQEDAVENDDLSVGKKIDNEDVATEEKENEERLGEGERAVSTAVDLGSADVVAPVVNVIKCSSEENNNFEDAVDFLDPVKTESGPILNEVFELFKVNSVENHEQTYEAIETVLPDSDISVTDSQKQEDRNSQKQEDKNIKHEVETLKNWSITSDVIEPARDEVVALVKHVWTDSSKEISPSIDVKKTEGEVEKPQRKSLSVEIIDDDEVSPSAFCCCNFGSPSVKKEGCGHALLNKVNDTNGMTGNLMRSELTRKEKITSSLDGEEHTIATKDGEDSVSTPVQEGAVPQCDHLLEEGEVIAYHSNKLETGEDETKIISTDMVTTKELPPREDKSLTNETESSPTVCRDVFQVGKDEMVVLNCDSASS